MIQFYLNACEKETDLGNFEELVQDFCLYSGPDGFDALYELEQKYAPDSDKGKIILKIRKEKESEPESIQF